jgi:hypothetical protein
LVTATLTYGATTSSIGEADDPTTLNGWNAMPAGGVSLRVFGRGRKYRFGLLL